MLGTVPSSGDITNKYEKKKNPIFLHEMQQD
jgi:hypothetical protein